MKEIKEIKGIILAGGTGSRLLPLTKVTNKHLLPIGKKPMILHPLEKIVEAGIKEIMIVTGTEHAGDIISLLGSGKEYDCRITYRVQDEAGGIAQALGLCENFVGEDHCLVILGDNIFTETIATYVKNFKKVKSGAAILLKQVADPERFGVAEVHMGKVLSIEEKPKKPRSDLAITGIYFYDNSVFDIIKKLKKSDRGELEITDVNRAYMRREELYFSILGGDWTDAGTFESYQIANQVAFRST